jgi:predicted SAM-dependent methyltransferase/cephalosporin hydroxylase
MDMPQQKKREDWQLYDGELRVADIGCGHDTPYFGPDVHVTRIDGDESVNPDVLCDIRAIPLEREQFDIVHARHVLEHFYVNEAADLVDEWCRLLKVGGELIVNVPNLAYAAGEVLRADQDENYDATYASWQLYGRPGNRVIEELHKCGYTKHGLARMLLQVECLGDFDIQKTEPDARGIPVNLTLRAKKVKANTCYAVLPKWQDGQPEEEPNCTRKTEVVIGAINRGAIQKQGELAGLYDLLVERKLNTVVEIGTDAGGLFWMLCQMATDEARIISLDFPEGNFRSDAPYDPDKLASYKKGSQVLQFIKGDSHDPESLAELKRMINGSKVDLLFIDGDHTYQGVKSDFEMYSPLVKKGGMIVFHDILFHDKVPLCQVEKFWTEIKGDYKTEEFIVEGDDRGWGEWGGIGVLYYEPKSNRKKTGRKKSKPVGKVKDVSRSVPVSVDEKNGVGVGD